SYEPDASIMRIHLARSFTLEVTPPAGDCASGLRGNGDGTHSPFILRWIVARFDLVSKSAWLELVEVMPRGSKSRVLVSSSHAMPAPAAAASPPVVIPKFEYANLLRNPPTGR